jgi:outer membrane protein
VLALLCPIRAAAQPSPGPISVDEAVRIGLRESPAVRAARADARAAAAGTRQARGMRLPQLSINSYLAYGDSANILSTTPGVAPQNSLITLPHGFADQNVMFMAPIYTAGKLDAVVRGAEAGERAAGQDLEAAQAETALQIRLAFYRSLLAREIVNAASARLDADTASLATVRERFAAGKEIEAAVQRVLAEQADAQRALTSARNDEAKTLLDLSAAMGVDMDAKIVPAGKLEPQSPSGDLAQALASAMQSRPDLRAARLRAKAAEAQVGATRASRQPQVYGAAMADAFGSPDRSGGGYTAGLIVSVPLLDAGERSAEIAQARAAKDRADAAVRSAELQVQKEVRQSWLDVETAAENYCTAQSALASAQAAYDVASLRVQSEKGILVEELDALAALTQARANVAMALFDNASGLARLQRAEGR